MGGNKRKQGHRQSLRRIRHFNILRREAELRDHDVGGRSGDAAVVQDQLEVGGGGGDVSDDDEESKAGFVDGDEESIEAGGGATEDVENDDTDDVSDADGIIASADTRRELVVAKLYMKEIGLSDFLKSAVGGKMKSQALDTALSRTVSLGQYAYEKVIINIFIRLLRDSRRFLFIQAFRRDDARS